MRKSQPFVSQTNILKIVLDDTLPKFKIKNALRQFFRRDFLIAGAEKIVDSFQCKRIYGYCFWL